VVVATKDWVDKGLLQVLRMLSWLTFGTCNKEARLRKATAVRRSAILLKCASPIF